MVCACVCLCMPVRRLGPRSTHVDTVPVFPWIEETRPPAHDAWASDQYGDVATTFSPEGAAVAPPAPAKRAAVADPLPPRAYNPRLDDSGTGLPHPDAPLPEPEDGSTRVLHETHVDGFSLRTRTRVAVNHRVVDVASAHKVADWTVNRPVSVQKTGNRLRPGAVSPWGRGQFPGFVRKPKPASTPPKPATPSSRHGSPPVSAARSFTSMAPPGIDTTSSGDGVAGPSVFYSPVAGAVAGRLGRTLPAPSPASRSGGRRRQQRNRSRSRGTRRPPSKAKSATQLPRMTSPKDGAGTSPSRKPSQAASQPASSPIKSARGAAVSRSGRAGSRAGGGTGSRAGSRTGSRTGSRRATSTTRAVQSRARGVRATASRDTEERLSPVPGQPHVTWPDGL